MMSPLVDSVERIEAIFPSATELFHAINSIKLTTEERDVGDLIFATDGLTVHWTNGSKSLQSGVFLGYKLFSKYDLSSSIELSLHIKTLLDVLKVFSASDVGAVTLVYPGDDGQLVLKSSIHMDGGEALSQQNASLLPMAYAYVQTVEYSPTANILDYLSDPLSSFLGMGTLFREALEDMDCAGKTVLIEMKQEPPQLTFSSQAQDIEIYVDVPTGKLTSFQCAQPLIEARYNRNYLKTALSALSRNRNEPNPETHLCKVSIDPEGLMKVTHMWKLAGIEPGSDGHNDEQQIGSSSTQDRPSVKQAMVVTQFAILPMAEIEEDDDNMSSRAL